MTLVGVDTNILAYAAGVRRAPGDHVKVTLARSLLASFRPDVQVVVPTQVWGELYAVLTRAGMSRTEARTTILDLQTGTTTAPVTPDIFNEALTLAEQHQFQIWDAIILKSCTAAGCGLLLSEDQQDGLRLGGVLIANPLVEVPHAAVQALRRGD